MGKYIAGSDPAVPAGRHVLEDCVEAATMAPSLHNSQPWKFRIADGAVNVYADHTRQLAVLDPSGRELMISVGAAVFNLRLRLRQAGHLPRLTVFPDSGQSDLVATVTSAGPAPVTTSRSSNSLPRSSTGTLTGIRSRAPSSPLTSPNT
ncbi:hypothetical protein [Actinoplanes sp. GCM10030250]|uniref:hypothetical protein n=1 Tax=Actinoplanes sp. GCM10030250 TaxID=3273376 RepID=UPI00360F49E9